MPLGVIKIPRPIRYFSFFKNVSCIEAFDRISDPYYTNPAQHLVSAGLFLDGLDRGLSNVWNIVGWFVFHLAVLGLMSSCS